MEGFYYFLVGCLVTGSSAQWDKACANSHSSLTTSTLHGQHRCHNSGELVFHDEFDYLDFDMWEHEITMSGGGNWEFQVYWNTQNNSYVKNGALHLKPGLLADRYGEAFVREGHLDLWGGAPADLCTANAFWGCDRTAGGGSLINPITSARLRTVKSFGFKYGRAEVRAKLPAGDWIWPAIWMLPVREEYGVWPTSGEIDMMESRGNRDYIDADGVNIGVEQFGSTLHYGVDYTMNGWEYAHKHVNSPPGNGFDKDFHLYQMEWTPDYISFSLDNEEIKRVVLPEGGMFEQGQFSSRFPGVENPWEGYARNAPFDKEFHFVLNVAVGGTAYFTDNASNGGNEKPWTNDSPQAASDFYNAKDEWYPTWHEGTEDSAMQIDYIKVWAL